MSDALLRTAVFDERPHRRPGVYQAPDTRPETIAWRPDTEDDDTGGRARARPSPWPGFQGTVFPHAMEITWHRPFFVCHIGFLRAGWAERGVTLCALQCFARSACLPMVW